MNNLKLLEAQAKLALKNIDPRARIGVDNYISALEARITELEVEKKYWQNNAAAWQEYAEHLEWCAECAMDVYSCERGSLLKLVASVKAENTLTK